MEYYFNELDPTTFQRLINGILVALFGEDARLTPLHGADGGRDGETAPGNPYFEFQVGEVLKPMPGVFSPPRPGSHLFQVKHHRTIDTQHSDARKAVIADFEKELRKNVLTRTGNEQVNYFFLITNAPSSKQAIAELDKKRSTILKNNRNLHADVWWRETVEAYLDQMPSLWKSFPTMFAGGIVPFLSIVTEQNTAGLPRLVRLALERQYRSEGMIKFRQIELERSLARLFVDLDVSLQYLTDEEREHLTFTVRRQARGSSSLTSRNDEDRRQYSGYLAESRHLALASALSVLINETDHALGKVILEGGPGQGKSTITQIAAQIYRQQILRNDHLDPEGRWSPPRKSRLPFRIELKSFAEWLNKDPDTSVEAYLAHLIKRDSGGGEINVDKIHSFVEV